MKELFKKILIEFFVILGCLFFVGGIVVISFAAYKINQGLYTIESLEYRVNQLDTFVDQNMVDIADLQKKIK